MAVVLIRISLKFVPKGPNNMKPAFVHIITWHWLSDKILPEAMVAEFIDTCVHQMASMGYIASR